MRNFGRAIAAFMICTAAAAALARPPSPSAADYATAGDPAAGPPVAADAPPDPTAAGASLTVAPMMVTQVTVTPSASEQTPTLPTPPVAAVRTGPPPIVPVPQAVYVANFIAVPAGAPPSGLLDRLRAAMHAHAAGHDAGLVAQAVVQRLNHAGLAARYLAPGAPPPVQGWLIGGAFHLESAAANGAESDGTGLPTGALGADVSVTVADLGHNADTPFALIGVPPAQADGSSKWQPYVVPAKLGFERADRNAAVAALARQIADAFVGNMTALRQADAKAISP